MSSNNKNLDLRYLSAFLATAKYLNFSRAAEELGIAQSAISRQIRLLEESIGTELFLRSPRHVMLTDKGRELHLLGQQFLEQTELTLGKEDHRPIRLGLLHGLLEDWISIILPSFLQKYPRSMQIVVQGPKELQIGLQHGEYDFIICDFNVQSEMFSSLKLFDEHLVLISKKKITKKEIQQNNWVTYGPNDYLHRLFKTSQQGNIQVNSITTIISLVRKGLGIAIVPDHAVQNDQNLASLPMTELGRNEIFLTGLNYHRAPERLQQFQDYVQKEAQKLKDD
jgi:DNA-binding transcriptional LysR family regulator